MKKLVLFIPAVILTAFYGWILIGVGLSVSPIVFSRIGLFIISGVLLSKSLFWGGFLGVLPGIYMMYMCTIERGQIINIELPMGIIISIFYLICCTVVFFKTRKVLGRN